jgi:hypothetical protein
MKLEVMAIGSGGSNEVVIGVKSGHAVICSIDVEFTVEMCSNGEVMV